jgi:homogentisate 1,2-dioxygenase
MIVSFRHPGFADRHATAAVRAHRHSGVFWPRKVPFGLFMPGLAAGNASTVPHAKNRYAWL